MKLKGICMDCEYEPVCKEDQPPEGRTRVLDATDEAGTEMVSWCTTFSETRWDEPILDQEEEK